MEEKVQILVNELQDVVRRQTKMKYPDFKEALTSLQDYVQDTAASTLGLEDKLKELEDVLSKKSEMKKLCTELIAKIRKAMRLQRNATTRGTKLKEEKRKPSSPATSERATPMPSQRKENKTLRSELTQPEETTELTGRIDQNKEEYRDEMADEVRFFMECLNGLKEVFSDDTKNPLETIIPVPNRKIKKEVETGYTYVMDVAGDIRRLKTENQYLKKTLDGLHKYIIGGDETALNELKTPKHMKDSQSVVEVEAQIKEVTQKFHEIKTNAENATVESKCLLSTMECLISHVRGLSEGNTEGDISSALDQIKPSVKKGSPANQCLTHAKEIIGVQMEWKRESEYATHLFKALNERLAFDGKQDTQISLKEPPIQMARASSKDGKKDHKKQNDEKPCKRHIEQLQNNFASASSVLKKLMNAEESIAERECLLSTLKCLCNYVRDLCEDKTEPETSPSWDEIWSSIKKESSANQGLSHAKEILSRQMEWKREAEYASNLLEELNGFATNDGKENRQVILKEPMIQMPHDSRTDAKKDNKKQTDQPPRSRHVKQLQRYFASASNVLKKQMYAENAIKERECLLLALKCLFEHSRDLSEGATEGDISSTLDQIKSSINKESSANQGLSHAKAISNIHMEWKSLRIDLGKRMEQVKDLMVRCKKLQEENNEIKNDADLLRTRLSEHAGALLTHDNPSIADLSDPNRPTKLSEMYSELYDNQWTDAFANIAEKDPDISENNIIGYLYEMLLDGYRFCEDVRQTQKSSLEDILFYPAGGMKTSQRRQKEEISAIFAKHLSDVAKLSSNVSSAHMAKAFVMDEKTKDKYRKMIKLCGTYIQKCVQLCWLMQVQTPPLYLDLKTIEGQAFNKICYKVYTKKGKKIAFVVWPALFLHENGPLLSKGVAQCQ